MGNAGNVEGHSQELATNNSWTYAFDDVHYGYATLAVHAANKSLTYTMYAADTDAVIDTFNVAAKVPPQWSACRAQHSATHS